MKISNPFRYRFNGVGRPVKAVLKVWFGQKYYIVKGKSAVHTMNTMAIEIDRRLRLGVQDGHMYELVVAYIRKARVVMMEADYLLESDDDLELLQFEHNALADASYDPDCLNTSFDAYVPRWISLPNVQAFWRWKNPEPQKIKNVTAKNNKTVSTRRSGGSNASVSDRGRRATGSGSSKKNTRSLKEKPEGDRNE